MQNHLNHLHNLYVVLHIPFGIFKAYDQYEGLCKIFHILASRKFVTRIMHPWVCLVALVAIRQGGNIITNGTCINHLLGWFVQFDMIAQGELEKLVIIFL